MARVSPLGENATLSGLITECTDFGLNTADPTTVGSSEVNGGSPAYARAGITWGSPSGGNVSNSSVALTANVPASTTINYFSMWNTPTISGTTGYAAGGALSASQTFSVQGTFTVAIGGLTVGAS